MGLNKKAIIFTFMSILLVALFSLIFLAKYDAPIDRKNDLIRTRVTNLNEFVENYESYTESILNMVGTRAVEGMIEYIDINKTPLHNFHQEFIDCALNGTLKDHTTLCPGMENNTLGEWLEKIENSTKEQLKIEFDHSFTNLTINQTERWYLDVNFVLSYTIDDAYARWDVTKNISTKIPIEGLRDPLYLLDGTAENYIEANELLVRDNVTAFEEFIENRQYKWSNGPSFIMRMQGDIRRSNIGIFSLAHPNDFTGIENKSYVDFLLFNNTVFDCSELYTMNNTNPPYNKVMIDQEHALILYINTSHLNSTC